MSLTSAIRRFLSILLGAVFLLSLGAVTPSVASAATNDYGPSEQTVGPPPPPPPTIEDKTRGCNPFGLGSYKTDFNTPERVGEGVGPAADGPLRGNGIFGKGHIDVWNNTSCSHAQVRFLLQTKVCNRWGALCSWRTMRHSEWQLLPIQGRVESQLTGKCRSGVDTYKMTAVVSHVEMSYEQTPGGFWVPFWETKTASHDSTEADLDCG